MSGDAEDRMAQVRAQSDHLRAKRRQRSDAREWAQKRVAAVEGSAATQDGLVRVRVDDTGMVTSVELSPRVREAQPSDLARAITAVAQRAVAHAREQVRAIYDVLRNEGVVNSVPSHLPAPPTVPESSLTLTLHPARHSPGALGRIDSTAGRGPTNWVDVQHPGTGRHADDEDGPPATWLDTRRW